MLSVQHMQHAAAVRHAFCCRCRTLTRRTQADDLCPCGMTEPPHVAAAAGPWSFPQEYLARDATLSVVDLGGCDAMTLGDGALSRLPNLITFTATGRCSIQRIGNTCLFRNPRLSAVDLTQFTDLTTIGSQFGCGSAVAQLDLGGWVASRVGSEFFAECPRLTAVVATSACAIEEFYADAFVNSTNLHHIDLTRLERLGKVNDRFLRNNRAITTLDVSGWKLQVLHKKFGEGCAALTEFNSTTMNATLIRIGDDVLSDCRSLVTINLAGFAALEHVGNYFGADGGAIVTLDLGGLAALTIGTHFMKGCATLIKVTMSDKSRVCEIGAYAFAWCGALQAVDLINAQSLVKIGVGFCEGSALARASLPEGVIVVSKPEPMSVTHQPEVTPAVGTEAAVDAEAAETVLAPVRGGTDNDGQLLEGAHPVAETAALTEGPCDHPPVAASWWRIVLMSVLLPLFIALVAFAAHRRI